MALSARATVRLYLLTIAVCSALLLSPGITRADDLTGSSVDSEFALDLTSGPVATPEPPSLVLSVPACWRWLVWRASASSRSLRSRKAS
jgi:hypothetical protein